MAALSSHIHGITLWNQAGKVYLQVCHLLCVATGYFNSVINKLVNKGAQKYW